MSVKARPRADAAAVQPLFSDRSSAVYQGLRRAIIEQALQPGDRLPEDAIGESFTVSRTLVRSALTRLASEGLIEQRRNKGAVVASPSLESARDIFDVRHQLEDLVVRRLCGRLTSEQESALYRHVRREESAQGRDGPESIRLAGEFHILLAEMTGNGLLARYVSEVVSRSSLILALYGRPHSSDCAVCEHAALIAAIAEGDAERAGALMRHHIGAVQARAQIERPDGDQRVRDVFDTYARKLAAEVHG